MNPTAKQLALDAIASGQIATVAMNKITAVPMDASNVPSAVFDVLYQQNEAIGQLCTAVLSLADEAI